MQGAPSNRQKNKPNLKAGAALACAGLLYGYVLIPLGLAIPCPFRAVTGLKCPGCGVTSMCLDLLHGHFAQAASHNYGLAIAAPLLLWLAISPYVNGSARRRRAESALSAALLAALLLWGALRNLYGL